jgi:hypothetical protein
MKKAIILSLFLVGMFSAITAQTNSKTKPCDPADARLGSKFSLDELKNMSETEVCTHIYILDNGYFIADIPSEKSNDKELSGARNIADLNAVNLYSLSIDIKENQYQYFKLLGTNKMIVIKPMSLINTERSKK